MGALRVGKRFRLRQADFREKNRKELMGGDAETGRIGDSWALLEGGV
jgi:hypothetical protein